MKVREKSVDVWSGNRGADKKMKRGSSLDLEGSALMEAGTLSMTLHNRAP
jgi:hypothetical protein